MTYVSLDKAYYKGTDLFEDLYTSRITSEHCSKFDIEINDNQAFFYMSPEVINLIIKIYEINQKVIPLYSKLPNSALNQFVKKCLVDEVILTNDIEGVHSSRDEINIIVNDNKKETINNRFYGLVQKYKMLSEDNVVINTCKDIRTIYNDLVLKEIVEDDSDNKPDGSIFRKEIANVVSATQKVIHNGVYPEEKIVDYMQKSIDILNKEEIPYLIRIAIFHYLFGFIHPFYDGNGRTSRFISSYLLSKHFVLIIGYRLSYTIKENINKYYKAFKICNNKNNRGDITPFVIAFLEIVVIAFEKLYESLSEKWDALNMYAERITSKTDLDEKEKDLVFMLLQTTLFSSDGCTKLELLSEINISPSTLNKRLKDIEDKGYLLKQKYSRSFYYSLNIDNI